MPGRPQILHLFLLCAALLSGCGGGTVPGETLPQDFALTFLDPAGGFPVAVTSFPLLPGETLTAPFAAYGASAPGGLDLALQDVPPGLEVTVDGSPAPTVWIQNVEWGQSVLGPGLRLVGGKPALLRVQLLADRAGVPAPPVTATVQGPAGVTLDSLELQGPPQVPVFIREGDLPAAGAPSGSSYTAILPARDIVPGMRLTLQAGAWASRDLLPQVSPGPVLHLTVVPVVCAGQAPVLPQDEAMIQALTAQWPLAGVNLAHRAPYTTGTALPQPADPANPAAWAQLLGELDALRIADGQTANYYGFVNPGITSPFRFGIAGLSRLGTGVGVGIDETAAGWFHQPGPDYPIAVLVHEQGHAFNLNHAPAGGAPDPQLDFPYFGAAIGSWGYDVAAQAAHDPALEYDTMSYAPESLWVSDWNYRLAQAFLEQSAAPAAPAAAAQWLVSGWAGPGGAVHLAPLVRLDCPPAPPPPGDLRLSLREPGGTRTIRFAAPPVADLPGGIRPFSFTVPAAGELSGAELRAPGGQPCRLVPRTLAGRARALDAAARNGTLVARVVAGTLHLEWDARTHPYVNVLHQGHSSTILALHLTGGAADLPLSGLPAGGQFLLQFSDGLNPVCRTLQREPAP